MITLDICLMDLGQKDEVHKKCVSNQENKISVYKHGQFSSDDAVYLKLQLTFFRISIVKIPGRS